MKGISKRSEIRDGNSGRKSLKLYTFMILSFFKLKILKIKL